MMLYETEHSFIISLTVLPNRVHYINNVLLSACNQNYKNFEVHLNVPKKTKFDGEFDKNFQFINHPKLKIFFVDDVGSITKIYHTLLRTTDLRQRIITIDDDFTLDENMLLVYNSYLQIEELKDAALGFCGIYPVGLQTDGSPYSSSVGCLKPGNFISVGMLENFKTALYRRDFFDEEFTSKWYKTHYNDDLVISSWLGYKKIKRIVIPSPIETNFSTRTISFPLVRHFGYKNSGVMHLRNAEGGPHQSYKKYYNSEWGKYLQ